VLVTKTETHELHAMPVAREAARSVIERIKRRGGRIITTGSIHHATVGILYVVEHPRLGPNADKFNIHPTSIVWDDPAIRKRWEALDAEE
jgi:hypothetical protein